MDALLPVIWWLDRRWGSFVARVASVGADGSAPAAGRFRGPLVVQGASARAVAEHAASGSRRRVSGGPAERPAVTGDGPADVDPAVSAPIGCPKPPTGRTPDWLAETHPEPPGAVALAAHLDARRAQAAALRALLFARQRRYAEAEAAFAQAASLDPALDLADLDGFWELGRGAHEAAVRAYDGAGRPRDAMVLRATLDGRYRPRLVRTA